MKTRFQKLDVNKTGYISVEDYQELIGRFIEYGKLSGEDEQRLCKTMCKPSVIEGRCESNI